MLIGNDRTPYRFFAKLFCRWDARTRILRLGRIVWRRGEMMKGGYTAKLSLALTPRLIGWRKEWQSYAATLLGVRLHYESSYGGWLA